MYADELATPDYMYYDLFKSLEMQLSEWSKICSMIRENDKLVYFDVFGKKSLDVALELGADGVKLSTTEFYNTSLFSDALSSFDRVFLSVGGIPVDDIDSKLADLSVKEKQKVLLMYGFQSEPTPLDQNNLNKIRLLRKRYPDFRIGFMDHSDGGSKDSIYLPLVALGVGLDAIEKHITLDHNLEIEDYVSGLTPTMFSNFTSTVRRFEKVFGPNSLDLSQLEEEYRKKATKSVVALRDIGKGETLTEESVSLKRSSIGIVDGSVLDIDYVLGKTLNQDILENHQIMEDMV